MSVCVLRVHVCAHPGCTQSVGQSSGNDFFPFFKIFYGAGTLNTVYMHKIINAYRVIIVKNFKCQIVTVYNFMTN